MKRQTCPNSLLRPASLYVLALSCALGCGGYSDGAEARDKPAQAPQSIDDLFADVPLDAPAAAKSEATSDSKSESKPEANGDALPASAKDEPVSLDELFVASPAAPGPAMAEPEPAPGALPASAAAQPVAEPASIDALFDPGADQPGAAPGAVAEAPATPAQEVTYTRATPAVTGFFQSELAYAYRQPTHWTKFRQTLELSSTGQAGRMAWKLGGRLSYDPIYDLTRHYDPFPAVHDDQTLEAQIREAYIDIPMGDWEFRLGRQHIVWGEMVGLFFADVVSAKDLRELALPDFEMLRIPQWAARAEYFNGDFHGEAVWVPSMTYDDIGKPGAEFYPFNPPAGVSIAKEDRPRGLDDGAYGLRMSYLKSGWDLSGFLYRSRDSAAAFSPLTLTSFQPIHGRISQAGATLGKDLGPLVLKAEAVYTWDKLFSRTNLSLVEQDLLDYIVGLEWSFPEDTRFNVQFYQRRFSDRDPGLIPDDVESGYSLMLSSKALHPKLEPKLLYIRSLNRDDWLAQFRLTWQVDGNWRVAMGADVFGGVNSGLFGQFDNKDRLYAEVRYSF